MHVDTRRRECSNGASGIIIIFLLFTKSLRLLAVVGIVTYSIEREVRNVFILKKKCSFQLSAFPPQAEGNR